MKAAITKNRILAMSIAFTAGLATMVFIAAPFTHAEDWGDTSYSQATASQPVDETPSSIDGSNYDDATGDTSGEMSDTTVAEEPTSTAITEDSLAAANEDTYDEPSARSDDSESNSERVTSAPIARSGLANISTVQNTYGVETEEKTPVKLYVSPFGGMTSLFGNTTADASAKYAAGIDAGLLISSNMLLEVGYTYSEQNLSNPRDNTTSSVLMGAGMSNVYVLKQNNFDAGVKLFFLGRESRFRPFFGGGFGYARSYLNYNPQYQSTLGYQSQYMSDFITNQVTGFGQVGAEFAFTRSVVLTAMFKLDGILSSSTSAPEGSVASQGSDSGRMTVGNSLSRTASYTIGAGLGVYF